MSEDTHQISGRDYFSLLFLRCPPEATKLLRAAPKEKEVFLKRGFSMGLDTSEGGRRDGGGNFTRVIPRCPCLRGTAGPFSPLSPA